MIICTRVYTRSNPNIPWHGQVLMTSAVNQKLVSYSTSGKMINVEKTFSEDGLTFTHKSYWLDQTAFDEYDNDPDLQEFWQQRNAYCQAVGITIGPKDLAISG